MNEISKFISVQKLWNLYDRCEEQLGKQCLSVEALRSPTTLQDTVVAKMQLIVIEALQEIEQLLLDEITEIGWYEDEDDSEQEKESKEAFVEEDK